MTIQQPRTNVKPQSASTPNRWAGNVHCTEIYQPGFQSRRILACARVAIGKVGDVPSLTLGGFKILDGKFGLWVAEPAEKIRMGNG